MGRTDTGADVIVRTLRATRSETARRQEALEDEAVGGHSGQGGGGDQGAGAGEGLDAEARGGGAAHEARPGIGDAGHARVGDEGDGPARERSSVSVAS